MSARCCWLGTWRSHRLLRPPPLGPSASQPPLLGLVQNSRPFCVASSPRTGCALCEPYVVAATRLVCSILGLGIKTDVYDADVWRFVGAFLVRGACCTQHARLGARGCWLLLEMWPMRLGSRQAGCWWSGGLRVKAPASCFAQCWVNPCPTLPTDDARHHAAGLRGGGGRPPARHAGRGHR